MSEKLCECGCGLPAPIAKHSDPKLGFAKGDARRFIKGHSRRTSVKRFVDKRGYVHVRCPGHPPRPGLIFEHRLVMENKLNRILLNGEHVHHINGIKDDNRPENLQLLSPLQHNLTTKTCTYCPLRKEIRLLRWELRELKESLQVRLEDGIR